MSVLIFSTKLSQKISHSKKIFEKRVFHKMSVLIFSTKLSQKISHSKKIFEKKAF